MFEKERNPFTENAELEEVVNQMRFEVRQNGWYIMSISLFHPFLHCEWNGLMSRPSTHLVKELLTHSAFESFSLTLTSMTTEI